MSQLIKQTKKLRGKAYKINELTTEMIQKMYSLFCGYYTNVSEEVFLRDLSEKSHVILMTANGEIQGFSTIQIMKLKIQKKTVYVVFSGDTVMNREYWGEKVLQKEFCKFALYLKLKTPFTKLYWFLISKGYKTYLLMTNNFVRFYPRYDKDTPRLEKTLLDLLCKKKFPEHYDPEKGLILFGDNACAVKDGIAPIYPELLSNPHVNFFVDKNPDYHKGNELVCIAEMHYSLVYYFLLKQIKRMHFGKKKVPNASF